MNKKATPDKLSRRVRTPLFPPYSEVRDYLTILEGESKSDVYQMMKDIWDQTGTPQEPLDWSRPSEWIPQRLNGESARLATKLWSQSEERFNPRYAYGSYLFISTYDLLKVEARGIYELTNRGREFLRSDPAAIRELDEQEGVLELLSILATKPKAMRADLLPEWSAFLLERSKFSTASTFKDTLRRRLVNLIERGLVDREGNAYSISAKGVEYLSADGPEDDLRRRVIRAITAYTEEQKAILRERLSTTPPARFEALISDLLEAMGYEDVQVTRQSGDRGVDVVGTVQFGITTVKEVVQVKRYKGSINRPILDQLRGALPYHGAIRGTIITLGTFTRGTTDAALFQGAAPVTLIDGDRLIELLIEHEVGIKKKPATLIQLDETYFVEASKEDESVLEMMADDVNEEEAKPEVQSPTSASDGS